MDFKKIEINDKGCIKKENKKFQHIEIWERVK